MSQKERTDFEQMAAEENGDFCRDLWGFLKENKKWWLVPLVVVMVGLALLMFLSSTGVAPFIYTLF